MAKYQIKDTKNVGRPNGIGVRPTVAILLLFGAALMIMPSLSAIPYAYAAVDKFGVEKVYSTRVGRTAMVREHGQPKIRFKVRSKDYDYEEP